MKKFKKPSGAIVDVNPESEALAIQLGWTPADKAEPKKEAPKSEKTPKFK